MAWLSFIGTKKGFRKKLRILLINFGLPRNSGAANTYLWHSAYHFCQIPQKNFQLGKLINYLITFTAHKIYGILFFSSRGTDSSFSKMELFYVGNNKIRAFMLFISLAYWSKYYKPASQLHANSLEIVILMISIAQMVTRKLSILFMRRLPDYNTKGWVH